jgi:hypothetical protein
MPERQSGRLIVWLNLKLELDDILPVVEAQRSWASLQSIGRYPHDAVSGALPRPASSRAKGILAGRSLPTIRWIYETLQKDDNQRIAKDYFWRNCG